MTKTKILLKIVPIIGLIVMTGALVFFGISIYSSIAIFSDIFAGEKQDKQTDVVQKVLLEKIESDVVEQPNLIDELEPDIDENVSSEPQDITNNKEGLIDLYELCNLKVIGILTGEDVESIAVINDPKLKITKQYRVGDSIRGAIVKEILSKKVIVRWNDRDIVLFLIEKPVKKRKETRRSRRRRLKQSLIIKPEKLVESNVVRKDVTVFHDDPDFLRDAKLKPILKRGKFEGVQISGVVSGSFLSVFGIKDGDLIIGMNEKKIFRKNANQFLVYLSHMRDVTVEVKRDGVIHQLKFKYHENQPEDENDNKPKAQEE